MIEKHQCVLNGIEVSYIINSSKPANPTIIFIHGFPFTSELWSKQLEGLNKSVTGIAYDIRGFGASTTNHDFFSIDLFAKDVLALSKRLCKGPVILCGISMGGYIALRAMEIAPQLVSGLILCDTNAMADSNESKLNRFASIDSITKDGLADFAGNFIKKVFSPSSLNKKSGITAGIYSMIIRNSVKSVCATQLALASRTDTSSILSTIKIPTLLIRGDEDHITTNEQMQFLLTAIPEAEYHIIENAGHLPNYEQPDLFNKVINAFIAKHFKS